MIKKIEVDVVPNPYEIVGVAKTNYRSKSKFEITVSFYWGVVAAGVKWQCYTDVTVIPYDKATETLVVLKAKVKAVFNALKVADNSEANLIFEFEHLTI